jgi:hypothetical protein
MEPIRPAYVAWRAGTATLFVVSIPGLLKSLNIGALISQRIMGISCITFVGEKTLSSDNLVFSDIQVETLLGEYSTEQYTGI